MSETPQERDARLGITGGPPRESGIETRGKPTLRVILFAWLMISLPAFALGMLIASPTDYHDLMREELIGQGCQWEFGAVPGLEADRAKLENVVRTYAASQQASYRSVRWGIYDIPESSPLHEAYPDAAYLGLVTGERCL